jgi:type 2 lantibiotic biosynthesis protein LanM
MIERDEILDVIGGAAGCIGALLALYEQRPSEITRQTAVRCGEHLLRRARMMPQGAAWPTEHSKGRALAGFSHGASGVAWALSKLAHVAGESRFQEMALQGLAYERSLFSSEEGNWPDLRELADPEGEGTRFMSAWCHGAPGIGLSRLNMLPYLDDAEIRAEIDVAVKTTINHGFGRNHSLCHGDLGNLELLLQAAKRLEDGVLENLVRELTGKILGSMEVNGWLCGVPLGVETPGFMMGLAGIGYGLLRLAEPMLVPSIMMLEPPR